VQKPCRFGLSEIRYAALTSTGYSRKNPRAFEAYCRPSLARLSRVASNGAPPFIASERVPDLRNSLSVRAGRRHALPADDIGHAGCSGQRQEARETVRLAGAAASDGMTFAPAVGVATSPLAQEASKCLPCAPQLPFHVSSGNRRDSPEPVIPVMR
jgi:hypothetical protein